MAVSEFAALGRAHTGSIRKLCYKLEWKPDFIYLEVDDIYTYCSGSDPYCSPHVDLDYEKLLICHFALKQLTSEIQKIDNQQLKEKSHIRRYVKWAEYKLARKFPKPFPREEVSSEYPTELTTRVAISDPEGNLLVAIAKNLQRIINGEADALEVIFNEGLVISYYRFTFRATSAFAEAAKYMDVVAHKLPNMKTLEIGAGTGSATTCLIQTLTSGRSGEDESSNTANYRFQEYTFTDILTNFFRGS